jgi:hypothetical protein
MLLSACATAQTKWWCERDYYCEKEALYRGSWNVDFHGGVTPIIWKSRGEVDLVACGSDATGLNPMIQLAAHLPKFNHLYKTPWTVGGKIGYAACENVEFNFEMNYLQANRKCAITYNVLGLDDEVFRINPGKYRLFDAYLGSRYYFNRIWCQHLSFYLGGKIGLTHRYKTCATYSMNDVALVPLSVSCSPCDTVIKDIWRKNNNVSGGLQLGFDVCFCNGWSVFASAEVVASCGPRANTAINFQTPTPAPLFATNLISGGIGTELRFPVTFGIKFTI